MRGTTARRLVVSAAMTILYGLAGGVVGCGAHDAHTSPSPPASTTAARAYLAELARIAARDATASRALNEVRIDWSAPATWGPALAAAEHLRHETAAIRRRLIALRPPSDFAVAHRALLDVYAISLDLVTELLDGMRAARPSHEIYLRVRSLAEQQFLANAAFRRALQSAATRSGVPIPPGIWRAYPTAEPEG